MSISYGYLIVVATVLGLGAGILLYLLLPILFADAWRRLQRRLQAWRSRRRARVQIRDLARQVELLSIAAYEASCWPCPNIAAAYRQVARRCAERAFALAPAAAGRAA